MYAQEHLPRGERVFNYAPGGSGVHYTGLGGKEGAQRKDMHCCCSETKTCESPEERRHSTLVKIRGTVRLRIKCRGKRGEKARQQVGRMYGTHRSLTEARRRATVHRAGSSDLC